jgi:hypothetical protein
VVSPAIEHARRQLLPLRWATWARLAALGLATGELGGSGACNFPGFHVPGGAPGHRADHLLSALPHIPPRLGLSPLQFAALAAVLVLLTVALGLVALYVSSVCRFILFDCVLTGRYLLRPGWRRWQPQGERLFWFNLVLGLGGLALFVLLFGVPLLIAVTHGVWRRGASLGPMLAYVFLLIMTAAALAIVFLLIHVLTKDFVVPQMAFEPLGPLAAWRRLLTMLDRERGGYAGYLAMKVVLAIASAIIFGVLSLILVLILTIPVVIVAVIAAVAGQGHAAWIWNPYVLTALVLGGCGGVAVMMFLIALVHAPATAFFSAYAMHFFAPRYLPLGAALHPPPPPLPSASPAG